MRQGALKRKAIVKAEALERPAPDEREQAAMTRAKTRVIDRRTRFEATLADGGSGGVSFGVPHNDQAGGHVRLPDMFGTCSMDFAADSRGMLVTATRHGGKLLVTTMRHSGKLLPTDARMNAALAMVDGIAPANEIEATLAMQMAATHDLAMDRY